MRAKISLVAAAAVAVVGAATWALYAAEPAGATKAAADRIGVDCDEHVRQHIIYEVLPELPV